MNLFPRILGREVASATGPRWCSSKRVMPRHREAANAKLEQLAGLTMPVLVANGDSDHLIPTRGSHLFAGSLPNATVKISPAAAHGEPAADAPAFLISAAGGAGLP